MKYSDYLGELKSRYDRAAKGKTPTKVQFSGIGEGTMKKAYE